MGLDEDDIVPLDEQIVGFSSARVNTRGYIDLHIKFSGSGRGQKTISVRYLIIDVNTSYNALLGWPSLNKLGAIVYTPHLAMKFPTERGGAATVHVDQRTTRECYVANLRLMPTVTTVKRDVNQRMVALTDLDRRVNDEIRMEPKDDETEWQLDREDQKTRLGGDLTKGEDEKNKRNVDGHQGSLCLDSRRLADDRPPSDVPWTLGL